MSLKQVAIALDQLGNTLLGGYADESLSARAWRKRWQSDTWYVAYRLIDGVFFWQSSHCQAAYQSEQERRQLPVEYRA